MPDGFVYLDEAVPGVVVEQKYASSDNFTEAPVPGYTGPRAMLSRVAAERLAGVQRDARQLGWSLLVWDAYRPTSAVEAFVRWQGTPPSARFQQAFCPRLSKAELFDEGYIATESSHSRGSTVDLTLCHVSGEAGARVLLDTGTDFDLFDVRSHTDSEEVSPAQLANRHLLRELMGRHGFVNFPKEWWHFTLGAEPFAGRSFGFPVRPDYQTGGQASGRPVVPLGAKQMG